MTGTALLINKDRTVRVLENVTHDTYEELATQLNTTQAECKIDEKVVQFGSIIKVVWCDDTIDWNYGY
ncbi:hypothetical protein [Oceanobacillus sp. CAU 1775]